MLCPECVVIGERVLIMENCHFSLFTEHAGRAHSPSLHIGDGSVVGPRTWFSCVGRIEVGADVLIGAGALIADAHHEHAAPDVPILRQPMMEPRDVSIGRGAYVGPGAAILSGVSVGEGAYVMPGAVVYGDIPDRAIAAGNPAEIVRRPDGRGGWIDSPEPRWQPMIDGLNAT